MFMIFDSPTQTTASSLPSRGKKKRFHTVRTVEMASVGPPLWLCFSFTVIQLTILLWGALRFQSLISFCQATNKSQDYPFIKAALLLLVYLYAPLVVISITLMWVGYDQAWQAGYFFLVFPFVSIIGFIGVVLVSRNDISNFVDVQRAARSKLPFQPIPPPLVVGIAPDRRATSSASQFGGSPPRSTAVNMPPVLPVRDGNVVDDDDAF